MRIKSVLVGIAVAMMAVACNTESKDAGNDSLSVKPQEEAKEASIKTFDDSVAYFMGQDAALAYWRAAKIDSTLSGKENAEQLLWVPPSFPYYKPQGVYKNAENFSKEKYISYF